MDERFFEMYYGKEDTLRSSSALRYAARKPLFEHDNKLFPHARHQLLWMLHNCVAHPVLALAPKSTRAVELHEVTSRWLNHRPSKLSHFWPAMPFVPTSKLSWWVLHNLVSHVAIGLVPCEATFKLHDWSAKKMDVEGWV